MTRRCQGCGTVYHVTRVGLRLPKDYRYCPACMSLATVEVEAHQEPTLEETAENVSN